MPRSRPGRRVQPIKRDQEKVEVAGDVELAEQGGNVGDERRPESFEALDGRGPHSRDEGIRNPARERTAPALG